MATKKFKKLSDEEKKYIALVHGNQDLSWQTRMDMLTSKFEITERQMRRWIKDLGYSKNTEEPQEYLEAKARVIDSSKKYYLITWCQNATPVHRPFLRNMEAYAKFLNADIHVIYGRYKNPTSIFTNGQKKEEWWDPLVSEYKDANRHNVNKNLSILSDVKVQPTAKKPLMGFEALTGEASCIIGHPRVHLKSLPVLEGNPHKILMSTGAVSIKNYTDSGAGKKGEFHHTYGFVIVEVKNDSVFFARQVTAEEDGSFIDLFFKVENEEVTKINSVSALVMGDTHVANIDPDIDEVTRKLIRKVKPEHIVIHDIKDGESISHHDLKDPIELYRKHVEGRDLLKKEVDITLTWLEKLIKTSPDSKYVVVRSNHDDFVDRWIKSMDWKKDIKNAVEYMEYARLLLTKEAPNGIVPYLINKKFPQVVTLDRDDSYKVKNWQLAVHGDVGQNGSRGSLEQFSKLNTKMVVGHYHSPERIDGSLAVGTSTKLRLKYNLGPSSWMHAHVIIHQNGKAQHIIFIDKEYTTLK